MNYGLGTENQDLPGFVVLITGNVLGAGSPAWGSGFLPSVYQGVEFRSKGDPVLFLSNPKGFARHLESKSLTRSTNSTTCSWRMSVTLKSRRELANTN